MGLHRKAWDISLAYCCIPRTPFPYGLMLEKTDAASDEEAQEILDKGYMKIVGMLLWAARGVYPECQVGMHQLSKVASRPSHVAWKAALHMVKWMHAQKDRGIEFSSEGNNEPVVFSDASNKPYPTDGLCQYGYCSRFGGLLQVPSLMTRSIPITGRDCQLAEPG